MNLRIYEYFQLSKLRNFTCFFYKISKINIKISIFFGRNLLPFPSVKSLIRRDNNFILIKLTICFNQTPEVQMCWAWGSVLAQHVSGEMNQTWKHVQSWASVSQPYQSHEHQHWLTLDLIGQQFSEDLWLRNVLHDLKSCFLFVQVKHTREKMNNCDDLIDLSMLWWTVWLLAPGIYSSLSPLE